MPVDDIAKESLLSSKTVTRRLEMMKRKPYYGIYYFN